MKLGDKFKELKKNKQKAFIAYIPFGYPSINLNRDIFLALQEGGVDVIELGIPFSDPLADGPIIQKATSLALQKGANIKNFFKFLKQLQGSLKIPVVVMSYYNPIFKFGVKEFFKELSQLGVCAVTVVDLPLEESKGYLKQARKFGIDTIFFITPTTPLSRLKKITQQTRGFIYYISVTGITGPRKLNYYQLKSYIKKVKKVSSLPVCVGFGIHNRSQVIEISKFSDGVIVGSEIIKFIDSNYKRKDFLERLKKHLRLLKG